jgi:sugar phosphate isomerase/epimerase
MTPGVFARTYKSRSLAELFARVRRDGFQAVQFNMSHIGLAPPPKELPAGITAAVVHEAKTANVTIAEVSGTYNMAHPDRDHRIANRPGFASVIAAAQGMAVSRVTLCVGSRDSSDMWRYHKDNASDEAWRELRGELDFALNLAGEAGITVGIEPEPGNIVSSAALARHLLDEVGTSTLGIVLDAANLLASGDLGRQKEFITEALDLLGGDLSLVHAKAINLEGSVVPAGKGGVDLSTFIAQVKATGYDGPLVGHGFDEEDAPGMALDLRAVIDGLEG